jgi:hypothetical protein
MSPYREPGFAGMVRFFCPVNDSPLSELARSYVEAFVVLGYQVRVIATRMADMGQIAGGPWKKHRGLFLTPITTPFVNVVCGEPFDWYRLYTVYVKNVLIASSPPAPDLVVPAMSVDPRRFAPPGVTPTVGMVKDEPSIAAQVAARYDAIVVPTMEISSEWSRIDLLPFVVPTDVGPNGAILHAALSASSLPTREHPPA